MAEADVPPSPPPPPLPPLTSPLPPGVARYGLVCPHLRPTMMGISDETTPLPPSRWGIHASHLVDCQFVGSWSIDTRYRGLPNASNGDHSYNGDLSFSIDPTRQADDPKSLGAMIARRVYAGLFPDSASSQYLSVLTNPHETETRRLDALSEALSALGSVMQRNDEASTGLTDAVHQGAIELARSRESETRRRVWELLRRTANPAALEALRLALHSDPKVEVRREAANSLFDSMSDPAVRAAFESAAASDPSDVIRSLVKLALAPNSERPPLSLPLCTTAA